MRSIKQLKNIKGKTALVRVDFNVPLRKGKVLDDFRIRKALPTIKFLLQKGAKVALITHLGKDGEESLSPVIKHFYKISKFPKSEVKFFPNIRKFSGEIKNDMAFAKKLAKGFDFYVNEAFSVSHRKHASIVSVPKFLPSYAGLQLEEEIKSLNKAFKPKHPFLFILAGAKFETKLPLIEKYLKSADDVFIGGALANDFLKAKGYEVGKSLVSDSAFGIKKFLKSKKLVLPADVLVYSKGKYVNKNSDEVKKGEIISDVGESSVQNLKKLIKESKFILWNGPLGKYKEKEARATKETVNFLLKQKGKEIILGGGDLASCIPLSLKAKSYKLKPNFFVSTGGGATLEYLTKGTLPGIKALLRSRRR